MCQTKRIPAFLLSLLLLLAMAIPAAATIDPMQPRYDAIYQTECYLETYSDGSAYVLAWADFVAGEDCDIVVKLERNGRVVKTWSSSSSSGYIEISRDVYGLSSGEYQAIMYITCGSDVDTVPSSYEDI